MQRSDLCISQRKAHTHHHLLCMRYHHNKKSVSELYPNNQRLGISVLVILMRKLCQLVFCQKNINLTVYSWINSGVVGGQLMMIKTLHHRVFQWKRQKQL